MADRILYNHSVSSYSTDHVLSVASTSVVPLLEAAQIENVYVLHVS
jgi:hypothetical protein